jgi:hypothetical protein
MHQNEQLLPCPRLFSECGIRELTRHGIHAVSTVIDDSSQVVVELGLPSAGSSVRSVRSLLPENDEHFENCRCLESGSWVSSKVV